MQQLILDAKYPITFSYENGVWSAECEYNYYKYSVQDIKFLPLKTATFEQISELMEHPSECQFLSDKILISWYIKLLDQNIVVKLDKETQDDNIELKRQIRIQKEKIEKLEEKNVELNEFAKICTSYINQKETPKYGYLCISGDSIKFHLESRGDDDMDRLVKYLKKNMDTWFMDMSEPQAYSLKKCTTFQELLKYKNIISARGSNGYNFNTNSMNSFIKLFADNGFKITYMDYYDDYNGPAERKLYFKYRDARIAGFKYVQSCVHLFEGLEKNDKPSNIQEINVYRPNRTTKDYIFYY